MIIWIFLINKQFSNPFCRVGSRTDLHRLETMNFKCYCLWESFRIRDETFVEFMSREFYRGQLIDECKGQPLPLETRVFRSFLGARYGILEGSVCSLVTRGSKAPKDAGFRSLQNYGHMEVIQQTVAEILEHVDESSLNEDKKKSFMIGVLTVYKAQYEALRKAFQNNLRVSVHTVAACQALQFSAVVLDFANTGRMTTFVETQNGLLNVALSRWEHGLLVVQDEDAFNWRSYDESSLSSWAGKFPKIHALNEYAKKHALRYEQQANSDPPCRICQEHGQKAFECPNKPAITCNRCRQVGHIRANCPSAKCTKCDAHGHWASVCPLRIACVKCGGFHSSLYCIEKRATTLKFGGNPLVVSQSTSEPVQWQQSSEIANGDDAQQPSGDEE